MYFKDLISVDCIEIDKNSIKISEKVRKWCALPYPNHKKGCPNYDKKDTCPNKIPLMEDLTEKYRYFYLLTADFDFKEYKNRRKNDNESLSEVQVKNLLYWQKTVKNVLFNNAVKICKNNNFVDIFLLMCGSGMKDDRFEQEKIPSMEAVGIDVFNIYRNNEIEFELKPVNKVVLSSLICSKNELKIDGFDYNVHKNVNINTFF